MLTMPISNNKREWVANHYITQTLPILRTAAAEEEAETAQEAAVQLRVAAE